MQLLFEVILVFLSNFFVFIVVTALANRSNIEIIFWHWHCGLGVNNVKSVHLVPFLKHKLMKLLLTLVYFSGLAEQCFVWGFSSIS